MLSLVLISRRRTCDVVAGCNWQRSAICPSGFPGHLQWIADVLKFAWNANRIAQVATTLPVNMDRIVLLEYVATADDVHIKYFHRWRPPTAASLPAVIAWDRLWFGDINVHIRRNGIPGSGMMSQVCQWHMRTRLNKTLTNVQYFFFVRWKNYLQLWPVMT